MADEVEKMLENENLPDNQYRCWICLEVFEKGWSDEEALAEAAELQPNVPIEDTGIVCDDCFKKAGFATWPRV